MANCRIHSIKPPCGYVVEGILKIWLLDFEDFKGFRFENNALYDSCLVTYILKIGDFIELDAPDMVAKYTSTGNYVHQLDTFISDLGSFSISNLHLATKRNHLVLFLTNSGRYFTFGYEAGATLSYQNQTADGIGSIVNINAISKFPLFEVSKEAFKPLEFKFNVDFDNRAFCEFDEVAYTPDFNKDSYCEIN